MLSARHRATPRCAKSRHTPARVASTSTAVAVGAVHSYPNAIDSWTQSEIACTRPQPCGRVPNWSQAKSPSWSDGQYRLGSVYERTSSGRNCGSTSPAPRVRAVGLARDLHAGVEPGHRAPGRQRGPSTDVAEDVVIRTRRRGGRLVPRRLDHPERAVGAVGAGLDLQDRMGGDLRPLRELTPHMNEHRGHRTGATVTQCDGRVNPRRRSSPECSLDDEGRDHAEHARRRSRRG